jgi:hypothetical protein
LLFLKLSIKKVKKKGLILNQNIRGPLSEFPANTKPDKISNRFSLYFLSEIILFYSNNEKENLILITRFYS